jgi:hypothetical protein
MIKAKQIVVSLLVLFSLIGLSVQTTSAAAYKLKVDICDDIDAISTAWHEIANALDEAEDLDDLDLELLSEDMDELFETTVLIGTFLSESEDEEEMELGIELLETMVDRADVEEDDLVSYLVDIMDDIVETMDWIVEYCDEA